MIEVAQLDTEPELCPYLPDRDARTRYQLVADLLPSEYDEKLEKGWRRFGSILFSPLCSGCSECLSMRVPVDRFEPSRSQRRVLRKNSDLRVEVGEPRIDEERLDLYRAHHADREARRGWPSVTMSSEEYYETFCFNAVSTLEFCYRLDERLVAVAYVGEAERSLNSIYAFIDPDFPRRSLGVFDVLCEIEEARRLGKRHLYLGYYVNGCKSMEYKAAYRPYELLAPDGWRAT
ncbi:MAG: arginyltransferase [Planctomycetes bacterium]|nr:arginyltransferase [Planctomycetota bacterium]